MIQNRHSRRLAREGAADPSGCRVQRARRATISRVVLALSLGLASGTCSVEVRADKIELSGGRIVDGKIIEEKGGVVTIKTRFGKVTAKRSEIVRIVAEKTDLELFDERLAAAKKSEKTEELWELAEWCQTKRLVKQHRMVCEMIVEAEPDHAPANKALGLVRHQGRWVTPEDRDLGIRKADEAAKRARGLVLHEGSWVTEEEKKNLERGLIRYKDKWVTHEEKMRLDGFIRIDEQWVPADLKHVFEIRDVLKREAGVEMFVALGEHAGVLAQDSTVASTTSEQLEAVAERIRSLFGPDREIQQSFSFGGFKWAKSCVMIFADDEDFDAACNALIEWGLFGEHARGAASRYENYADYWPPLFAGPRGALHSFSSNLIRIRFKGEPPVWLMEGIAHINQLAVDGRLMGKALGHLSWDVLSEESLRATLRRDVQSGVSPDLERMMRAEWDEISLQDMAQAVGFSRYLYKRAPLDFGRFIDEMAARERRKKPRSADDWVTVQGEAIKSVYGIDMAALQRDWAEFLEADDYRMTDD